MAIRPTLKEFREYIVSQGNKMELASKKARRLKRENRQRVIVTAEDYAQHVEIRHTIVELDMVVKKHERNIHLAMCFSKCLYPFRAGLLKQYVRKRC